MIRMNEVYIITSGEYEDYHICAVFSERHKAEEIVDELCGEIEVWNLDDGNTNNFEEEEND